jgi:hypothetical protein
VCALLLLATQARALSQPMSPSAHKRRGQVQSSPMQLLMMDVPSDDIDGCGGGGGGRLPGIASDDGRAGEGG